jgi:hypothetical protein
MRSNLRKLHMYTSQNLDIHYLSLSLAGLLMHIGYEVELRSRFMKFNVQAYCDYDSLDPVTLRDSAYDEKLLDVHKTIIATAYPNHTLNILRGFKLHYNEYYLDFSSVVAK